MSESITEKQLNDALTQVELRLRRQWRDDFAAALRGQVNDLVAHVEARVEAHIQAIVAGKLRASVEAHQSLQRSLERIIATDREFLERYRQSIRDEIRGVCLKILQEFRVIDENGTPAKAAGS
jgi:uncharacterized protein YnzC (UPF0291/DUF896 family)